MVKTIVSGLIVAALSTISAFAQDIHYTQFDASPLSLNPAFTGMFNGSVRASTFYSNQWKSVSFPYVTLGASVDLPVLTLHNGDYIGAGAQVVKDKGGDGQWGNFSGIMSVAYHKLFGYKPAKPDACRSDLSIGLQAGYMQQQFDVHDAYFSRDIPYSYQTIGIGNNVNYYVLNAGLSFSQSINQHFNYTVGLAVYNLNQPNDRLLRVQAERLGTDLHYTGSLGFNWMATKRLVLKPAIIYTSREVNNDLIAGSEFSCKVSGLKSSNLPTSVFVGAWYRTGDATMATVGAEIRNFRVGIAYDYKIIRYGTNGGGGFGFMLRYTAGQRSGHRKPVPCNRF